MITIVCVYNNRKLLQRCLLKSLEKQKPTFELLLLDNTKNKYKSAAEAWNFGGAKAKGDYIMFVHQDFWFGSNSDLEQIENDLSNLDNIGVAGVSGIRQSDDGNKLGRSFWSISTYILDFGNKIEKPEQVQTLDDCNIIIPASIFKKQRFDEKNFDGWDCYSEDYCLSALSKGYKNYVIPFHCGHSCLERRSGFSELQNLYKYQQKVIKKHKKNFKKIFFWLGRISLLRLIKSAIWDLFHPHFLKIFPDMPKLLDKELANCVSILDLGCGPYSPLYRSNIPLSVGVELFSPYLKETSRLGIHNQLIQSDITKLPIKSKSFDAVIAIEVLEHLNKSEGLKLLKQMEKWARKKVIITTPNGFVDQETYDANSLQNHKSGWNTEDLKNMGYKINGFMGLKYLRGNKGQIRYNPEKIWERISNQSQRIVYNVPNLAFQLFAKKEI